MNNNRSTYSYQYQRTDDQIVPSVYGRRDTKVRKYVRSNSERLHRVRKADAEYWNGWRGALLLFGIMFATSIVAWFIYVGLFTCYWGCAPWQM